MKIIIAVLVLCVSLWGQTLYESPQTQQFCDGQPAIQAVLTPFLNQLSGYLQTADGNSAQNLGIMLQSFSDQVIGSKCLSMRLWDNIAYLTGQLNTATSTANFLQQQLNNTQTQVATLATQVAKGGPANTALWWNLVGNTGPLGVGAKVWWVENSGLQGSDATPVSVPFNATGGRMYITISSLAPQANPNAITTYSFLDCGQGACPANPPVLMSCQIAQAGNGTGQSNATHCTASGTFNLAIGDNLIMQATQAGAVSTSTPVWVLLDFSGVS